MTYMCISKINTATASKFLYTTYTCTNGSGQIKKRNSFLWAIFDIGALARLGKVSLRSPSPSLGMFFVVAVIGPDCAQYVHPPFGFQWLTSRVTPPMFTLCLHAMNQLCESEGELYFGDHDVCKIRPRKIGFTNDFFPKVANALFVPPLALAYV